MPAYWRHHTDNPDVGIFLLGAKPGVAEMARQRINRLAGREIVVGALGPSFNFVNDEKETAAAIETINESGATCLIVGLGAEAGDLDQPPSFAHAGRQSVHGGGRNHRL